MDDFFGFLKKIAPTIAGVVGTPAAGIALEALISAFDGDEDKARAVMRGDAQLTSADIAAIKIAEIQAAIRAKELDITLEQLAVDDRISARKRETQVKDNMPKILAFMIIGAFIAMCFAVLYGENSIDTVLAGTVIGYLSAKAEQVAAYYFGSSAGSARKTELIGVGK